MTNNISGGLAYTIGTLDPYDAATSGGVAVLDHVHDTLRRRDPATGRLDGGLAEGTLVRVGEHEYELTLRPDALFNDGTEVTAEDAAAAVRTMVQATGEKGQLLGESLRAVRDALAVGERTLRLHTAGPMPLLDERLALVRVIPQHWQNSGLRRAYAPATGPYRIVEASSATVALEPAETYPGASLRPLLTLRASPDASERLDGLLGGEFDAIEDPSPTSESRISLRSDLEFGRQESQNILWLMFNCADQRLKDVRVRRAIVHALDRDGLSRHANGGDLVPADSLLPSWHADYAPCPMYPQSDVTAAKELLAAAGYGSGLELRLAVSSASWVEANADTVVSQLARAGIDVTVTVAHTADLFSAEVPAGDYDLLLSSGDPSVYGVDGEFVLRWYLGRTWARGYCHWQDPVADELESLFDQASIAPRDLQRDLLATAQRLCAEQVPIAPLGHRKQPSAWSTRLTGFRPSRTTGLNLRTPFRG
ncbi:ABC transporter substrate-binding protein [Subtercola sp. PAMC28395]|uniref:ABC transporter substrate-binding protein n=1 Tax=Subtercola sp. PAMC28395 TaxID=2846775 RepID=UPI001C0B313D|nr:ABC transporter substrate-binding protein [Subtercola sp. PAMC28395]QWT24168.1 ABC transporter substrate-binding protein [Subtercola sp. PAMC28395]